MKAAPRVNYDPERREGKPVLCGFCATGNHDKCPRVIGGRGYKTTLCPCTHGMHTGVLRCLLCKRPGDVESIDPESYTCVDWDGCAARQRETFQASPIVQFLQKNQPEGTEMTTTDETRPTRRTAEPKPPKECVCRCGGQTKGGNFLPGHDARYVSTLLKGTDPNDNEEIQSVADALYELSPKLSEKYTKGVGIARTKLENKKADAIEEAVAEVTEA